MRFWKWFIIILSLWLCFFLLAPLKQNKPQTIRNESLQVTHDKQLTIPQNKQLAPNLMANLINQNVTNVGQYFGDPQFRYAINENQVIQIYKTNNYYLEVTVDTQSQTVQKMFILGENATTLPFESNMSFRQFVKHAVPAANFKLSLHEQVFQLELTERQMQVIPLVEFENQTFMIGIFDKQQLIGQIYVNADQLLKLNAYQVVTKVPIPVPDVMIANQNYLAYQQTSLACLIDFLANKQPKQRVITPENQAIFNGMNQKSFKPTKNKLLTQADLKENDLKAQTAIIYSKQPFSIETLFLPVNEAVMKILTSESYVNYEVLINAQQGMIILDKGV